MAGVICHGPSPYLDLAVLADGTIGCLFERREKGAYERTSFALD